METLKKVKKKLGVSGKIGHRIYKLLLYEKGSFFAPHRDTEKDKINRMDKIMRALRNSLVSTVPSSLRRSEVYRSATPKVFLRSRGAKRNSRKHLVPTE